MNTDRLTSLRGLAALAVVMFHALLLFPVLDHGDTQSLPLQLADPLLALQQALLIASNGDAAVLLFFILSGCVLGMSLARGGERLTLATVTGFYLRRCFRIYPALWVAVLLGAAAIGTIIGARVPALTTDWAAGAYGHELSWKALVGGALGIDNRLNQPLWSLAVELVYSFAFPFIFLVTRRPATAFAAVVASVVLMLLPMGIWAELNIHALPFVLGAIIAAFGRRHAAARGWWWPALAAASLLLLAAARPALGPLGAPKPVYLLLENIGAAGIVYLVLCRRVGEGWLEQARLVWLGEISYGVYILHFPIMFLLATGAGHAFSADAILALPILANILLGLVALAVTLPAAALLHRVVEMPGIALGRGLSNYLRRIGDTALSSRHTDWPVSANAGRREPVTGNAASASTNFGRNYDVRVAEMGGTGAAGLPKSGAARGPTTRSAGICLAEQNEP